MANPYGSMSAMSNPYENIYNNLYQTSNQQQVQNTDPNKFVYNPKLNQTKQKEQKSS